MRDGIPLLSQLIALAALAALMLTAATANAHPGDYATAPGAIGGHGLRGTASDRGCRGAANTRERPGAVLKVTVAVGLKAGTRCRFVSAGGRLGAARSCRRPVFVAAKGTKDWRVDLRGTFPAGTYGVSVRARDAAGNRELARSATLRLRAPTR